MSTDRHRSTDQRIRDLAMIRDSLNNARANLDIAMEAAKRSHLGTTLVQNSDYSARNPQAELLSVHAQLRGLESTWSKVPWPEPANLDT